MCSPNILMTFRKELSSKTPLTCSANPTAAHPKHQDAGSDLYIVNRARHSNRSHPEHRRAECRRLRTAGRAGESGCGEGGEASRHHHVFFPKITFGKRDSHVVDQTSSRAKACKAGTFKTIQQQTQNLDFKIGQGTAPSVGRNLAQSR